MTDIIRIDDHHAGIQGDLLLTTVSDLLAEGNRLLLASGGKWNVSLAGVGKVSSAGVALLLEWMRSAAAAGVVYTITDLPQHMQPIISISDLEPLFEPVLA